MGLFDKASDKFRRASEETIRMVDYDALEKEEEPKAEKEPKAPREKKPKPPKEPKAPRPKLSDLLPQKKEKPEQFEDQSDDYLDNLTLDSPDEDQFAIDPDTAFDLDDTPNFYEETQKKWEEVNADRPPTFEPMPEEKPSRRKKKQEDEIEYDEQKIADVLEVLRIPATFSISSEMLMPEDFGEIEFDLQMPQGYDIGQVEFFVERTESSVREYLSLLEQRNEHIARLATTIDRLQVDLQNLKYDNQIAAGIGVMPTSDNDELERENMELRVFIKKLENELESRVNEPVLTSEERDLYENLRNQYSVLQRENHDLSEEIYNLKNQLQSLEESIDEGGWGGTEDMRPHEEQIYSLPEEIASGEAIKESDFELPDLSGSFGVLKNALSEESEKNFELPVFDDEEELPAQINEPRQPTSLSNVFIDDDDDEEDELDKLMKDWGN